MSILTQQALQNSPAAQGRMGGLHLEGTRDGAKELPIILPVELYEAFRRSMHVWVVTKALTAKNWDVVGVGSALRFLHYLNFGST